MLKGFRASISHDVTYGQQPLPSDVYVRVPFFVCLNDTTGRYDATQGRWTPVLPGEPARYVLVGAKLKIQGGLRAASPLCNCKILRNGTPADAGGAGHYEANIPLSGTNGPDAWFPGMAEMQANLGILANPGDYFEVWAMVSAQPDMSQPCYSYFGAGTTMIDPHYGHTAFWGVDDPDTAALLARVATLEDGSAAFAAELASLVGEVASLATLSPRVTALEAADVASAADLAALAARVTALEPPPPPLTPGTFGAGTFGTGNFG